MLNEPEARAKLKFRHVLELGPKVFSAFMMVALYKPDRQFFMNHRYNIAITNNGMTPFLS